MFWIEGIIQNSRKLNVNYNTKNTFFWLFALISDDRMTPAHTLCEHFLSASAQYSHDSDDSRPLIVPGATGLTAAAPSPWGHILPATAHQSAAGALRARAIFPRGAPADSMQIR